MRLYACYLCGVKGALKALPARVTACLVCILAHLVDEKDRDSVTQEYTGRIVDEARR